MSVADEDPIRQLFQGLDKDQDGVLNKSDLQAVMPDLSEEKINQVISLLDSTGTGKISMDDFLKNFESFLHHTEQSADHSAQESDGAPAYEVVSEEELGLGSISRDRQSTIRSTLSADDRIRVRELFDSLDVDSDGYLHLPDFKTILPDVSLGKLQEIFKTINTDHTGNMSYYQFEDGWDELCRFSRYNSRTNSIYQMSGGFSSRSGSAIGVDAPRPYRPTDAGLSTIGEDEESSVERQTSESSVMSDDAPPLQLHSAIDPTPPPQPQPQSQAAPAPVPSPLAAPVVTPAAPSPLPPQRKVATPKLSLKERVSQIVSNSNFTQFQQHLDTDQELTYDDEAEDAFYAERLAERKAQKKERLNAQIDLIANPQTKEAHTDKDDEIALLKERVENMKARSVHLQKKYTLLSQLGRQLQDENLTLSTKLSDCELNLKMAKNEVLDARSQLELYKEKAEAIQTREKHLSKAVKSQEETYEETQAQLSHELRHRQHLNVAMTDLKEQLTQLQALHHSENRENLRSRIGKMKDIMVERKNQSVTELQKSVEQLSSDNQTLNDKLSDSQRLVEEKDNEIAELRRLLEQRAQFKQGRSLADELADADEGRKRRGVGMGGGGDTIRNMEDQKRATIKRAADLVSTLKKTGTLKTPVVVNRPGRGNTITGSSPYASSTSVFDSKSQASRHNNPMSTLASVGELSSKPVRKRSMLGDKLLRKSRKERAKRDEENKAALAVAGKGGHSASMGSQMDYPTEDKATQTDDIPATTPAADASLLAQLNELRALKDEFEHKYLHEEELREALEQRTRDLEARIGDLERLLRAYQLKEAQDQERQAREEAEMKRREEEAKRAAAMVKLSALDQAELTAYALYFNFCLQNDDDLKYLMPLAPHNSEFITKIKDGWLIAKFLNYAVPGTVDERALNRNATGKEDGLNKGEVLENMTLALESCKAIGVQVSDISATSVILGHHNPQVVLSLIWRLIMTQLLLRVNLQSHPELAKLVDSKAGEEIADLARVLPQQMLLRWVNHHTKEALTEPAVAELIQKYVPAAKGSLAIRSFLDEPLVQASFVHAVLMHALFPAVCDISTLGSILSEPSPTVRASYLIAMAKKLGIPQAKEFITPHILVQGGPLAARLTTAFTISLFSVSTGLEAGEEVNKADVMSDDVGDSREERAFRMWINSMNIPNENNAHLYIHNLFTECKDGLVLLRIMDRIKPGSVNWKKVEKNPNNRFKKLANCNEVIRVAKEELGLSVVGIAGADIVDGNRKLTLSIIWQLMHFHITEFLNEVYVQKLGAPQHSRRSSSFGGRKSFSSQSMPNISGGTGGSPPGSPRGLTAENTDGLIVKWANKKASDLSPELASKAANLRGTAYDFNWEPMKSFNDPKLADCLFFFHLLWSVEPRVVNWKLITDGQTLQDRMSNARYAISVARKMGAQIFLLPEDLVEVKPKMITSFVASILALEGLKSVPA